MTCKRVATTCASTCYSRVFTNSRAHTRSPHCNLTGFQRNRRVLRSQNHLHRSTSKAVMGKCARAHIIAATTIDHTPQTHRPNKWVWTCESRVRLENCYCTFQPMNLLPIKFPPLSPTRYLSLSLLRSLTVSNNE